MNTPKYKRCDRCGRNDWKVAVRQARGHVEGYCPSCFNGRTVKVLAPGTNLPYYDIPFTAWLAGEGSKVIIDRRGRKPKTPEYPTLTPAEYAAKMESMKTTTTKEDDMNTTTDTRPRVRDHRVFATDNTGTYLVSDDLTWGAAQREWTRLDDLRRAGYMPHVKFFEVRSTDDPTPRFAEATLNTALLRATLKGKGYASEKTAGREAWRHVMGDRFHDRGRKSGRRRVGNDAAGERTGVQGRGGWFYYRNGVVAAQGLDDLARVAKKMNLMTQGVDGRWYVFDADVDFAGLKAA